MALATLSIDIEAKLAKLEEGMSRATRVAERNASQIEARYAKIGTAVRGVAGVIATAFTATAFASFIRGTITGLDALNDLKDATGASIENLSALEDTAVRTGTSFESVSSSLIKFNKTLLDAKPGSDIAKVFETIGLKAEQLRREDPAEALRKTAVALAKFADDGDKARIVASLFGRSVAEVAPLLNDLAKQSQLVATVTTAEAEAAEKFSNQLAGLGKNVTDASRGIVSEMLPALNRLAQALADTVKAGGLFTLWNLQLNATFNATRLKNITERIADLQEVIDKKGATEGRVNELRRLQAEFDKTSRAATAASEAIKKITALSPEEVRALENRGQAGGGRGFFNPDDVKPGVGDAVGRAGGVTTQKVDLIEQYADKLRQALRATQDLSLAEQLRVDIVEGKLGNISNAARDYLIELASAIDQAKAVTDSPFVGPDIDNDVLEKRRALTKEINNILENTPTAKLAQQREILRELTAEYERGRFGIVSSTDAIQAYGEAAQTALGTLPEQWQQTTEKMSEFTLEAARNIQDALGDTVLRTLKGDFESIGDLWADMIQRMIAEALSAKLAQALLGNFGATGNVGGLFGDFLGLFGLAKGGAFQGGVQTFGTGGVVTSPHLFPMARGMGLMGEAGPEAIMPLRRGRDGKLGVASQGGGMTIINNVAAGVTRNEVLTALQLTAQSLRSEFTLKLRAAGVA